MNFDMVLEFWRLLMSGVLNTIKLSIIVILTSTLLGFIVGVLFTSKNKILKAILLFYVELLRGAPLLMLLYMGYFGLSYLGYDIGIWTAVIIVYTLYGGAYIAEIIRSGIESIPKGQWEASRCIGLKNIDIFRYVIIPQTLKISLPPLVGFYLGLIKDTSIAAIIGFSELVREGKTIMNITAKPFETYIIVAIMYFIICFPLSKYVSYMEKRGALQ